MAVAAKTKTNLYVDAMVLAQPRMSGVGHLTLHMIRALLVHELFTERFNLHLVVPYNKTAAVQANLDTYHVNASIKKLYLPARGIELLSRLKLLPPMDLFLGNGVYLFPNYKNWPLLRSRSYTYVYDLGFIKYPEFVVERYGACANRSPAQKRGQHHYAK
jgi:hypothetical protein